MSTERFELIAPCHFGLEAVLKREILDLGYEISKVEDGKVTFWQMPGNCRCQCFSAHYRAYSSEDCGSES